jgi:uncharacterized integral membrane protein (TIGR00698 family)
MANLSAPAAPPSQPASRWRRFLFAMIIPLCAWPRIDGAMALAAGIVLSLTLGNPFAAHSSKWSKVLLQLSVVGLGFGIGIGPVLAEGRHAILYTMAGIALTLLLGRLLGRLFGVSPAISTLVAFGTAICGGSAIAAMAPVIKARDEEIAVALATVFSLNSLALVLFPPLGHLLHLEQARFGLWAALAIHDTSSVVGAAAAYGTLALAVATTVKLTRALWITPVVLGTALFKKNRQKTKIPLFILGFVAAAVLRSLLPQLHGAWDALALVARRLLVVTLFLIGAGLTRAVLKRVGVRPLIQGVSLWLLVSVGTLLLILNRII